MTDDRVPTTDDRKNFLVICGQRSSVIGHRFLAVIGDPLLEVSRNLAYMDAVLHQDLYKDCNDVTMMLNRFIGALNK